MTVKYLHKYIHKGGDRAQCEWADYAPGEFESADGYPVEDPELEEPHVEDEIIPGWQTKKK